MIIFFFFHILFFELGIASSYDDEFCVFKGKSFVGIKNLQKFAKECVGKGEGESGGRGRG